MNIDHLGLITTKYPILPTEIFLFVMALPCLKLNTCQSS